MSESANRRMSESAKMSPEHAEELANSPSGTTPQTELSPAVRDLTESFRRRLGTLDPQQVAIWRQMTPARKLRLAFQMYDFARRVIWTTERQANPDASPEELSWRMLRRLHGKALCSSLQARMN
jgi:hypothetical protein